MVLRATAALIVLGTPALAEVCDKVRPGWDPSDGPIGPVGEAIHLATSPPGLVLIALLAATFVLRNWALAGGTAIAALALVALIEMDWRGLIDGSMVAYATAEGCKASPTLFSAVAILLAGLGLWLAVRGRSA